MSVNLSILGGAGWQFFDNNGIPLAGGKLYTYLAGTTTPLVTYTDYTGVTPNANPIILDSAGRPVEEIWVTTGTNSKFTLKTSTDIEIWTKDNIPQDNSGSGAGSAQLISVTQFGAIGNGIVDDTASLISAVSFCFISGDLLYWPPGTYLTTSTIPNLHNVVKLGPGVIKRGTNLFYVDIESNQSNTIYLDSIGNLLNDGLSPASPISTVQQGFDVLVKYGPCLNGQWILNGAAGTYNGASVLVGLNSINPIIIEGPPVGHPVVPTMIIDGTALGIKDGMTLSGGIKASVQNILYKNWNVGIEGRGLVVTVGSDLVANNVHTSGCRLAGIAVIENSTYSIIGGIIDGIVPASASNGILIAFASSGSLGIVSGVVGDSTIIKNCEKGVVEVGSSSMSGTNINVNNNTTGIEISDCSHLGLSLSSIGTNGTGIKVQLGSSFEENVITANVYSGNTINNVNFSSADSTSNSNIFYDKATTRWLYGANGSTVFYPLATDSKFQWQCSSSRPGAIYDNHHGPLFDMNGSANALQLGAPAASELYISFQSDTAGVKGKISYNFTNNNFQLIINATVIYIMSATSFIPNIDNTVSLGSLTNRWTEVFAVNGTINTSDGREKQNQRLLTDIERVVAVKCKSLIRAFKRIDAVEKKGDKARIHFGVIAQDIKQAFESEGLDPNEYGLFCYDEWEEIQEVQDKDGKVITAYQAAGNRYGIRYDELFAFIIGAM